MSKSIRESLEANYDRLSKESAAEENDSDALDIPDTEPETDTTEPELEVSSDAPPATVETPEQPEPLDFPAGWDASVKDDWTRTPRSVQEHAMKRVKDLQAEFTRTTQEAGNLRKTYEPVVKAVEPHMQYLQEREIAPDAAINAMFQTQYSLDSDPVGTLLHLARTYGLSAAQLAQAEAQGGGQQLPPHFRQLQNQVQSIQQTLSEQHQRTAQAEQEAAVARLEQSVNDFRLAKNEKGELKRPHFDVVAQHVQGILPQLMVNPEMQGKAPDELLQLAYDEAMKPYSALIESDKQKRIEKAKRAGIAGGSIAGAAAGAPQVKGRTLRESLELNADRIGFRM